VSIGSATAARHSWLSAVDSDGRIGRALAPDR